MGDDIDEVAVERACRGERMSLNRAEVAAAFRMLDERGYSAKRIGELLGTNARTVVRWRSGRHRPFPLPRAEGHGGRRERVAS